MILVGWQRFARFVLSRRDTSCQPLLLALTLLLCAGCANLPKNGRESRREEDVLAEQLRALGPQVDRNEAARLARAAVEQAIQLAHDYRAVRPAWLHNVLVNHGLRARGLCFEWTNDLFLHLQPLRFASLDLHLAVARMDTPREHNAIVITAHGEPFQSGVVLDAWRHSGRLWSGLASTDKYPWVPLPNDRMNEEIRKRLGL